MLTFPITLFSAGITTITQQASATSTASTITVPASVIAGDVLVLFDRPISSGTPSNVTPTGWSVGNNQVITNFRMNISYKLAVGADAGATVTGMNGNVSNAKMMYVFRPNIAALVLTLGNPQGGASSGAVSVTTTAGSGVAPLVVIGAWSQNGSISSRTMSPAKDGEINASSSAYLGYKIYNTSPANVTVSISSATSANSAQALYLVPTLV